MSRNIPGHDHPNHHTQLRRLNRIVGQLEGVKKMIEENRYCPDILVQLRAVHSAVRSVEAAILESHLESCVREAFQSKNEREIRKKVAELTRLYKRSGPAPKE